jgi:nicotinamidase-related amidase
LPLASGLPLPPHFDPGRVGEVWRVSYQQRADEADAWAKQHAILPAASDGSRVCLLLIDCQNTFCIPGFELFVGGRSGKGAVDDNVRICEFIYRNLGLITEIIPTLDTHTAWQIFHSVFLVDDAGRHPPPLTRIALEDVERGRWKINPAAGPASLQEHLRHYCRKLAESGKFQHMIWPYHAMLGGIGHALVSAVEEAVFFHSIARQAPTRFEMKGSNPLVENYSALKPEVLDGHDGRPIAAKNAALIERLLEHDTVVIAGQAKSHCVAWTIDDLLTEIRGRDPQLARKVVLLEDCTSPVVVPGVVDFTDQAEAAFARFADAGMHRLQSTQWPGMK